VLHIAPWSAPYYLEALKEFGLTHLIVYTNSLYALACEVPPESAPVLSSLKVILTNAEPLFDFQRKKIEATFGCPVRETYGQAEMVCAASECEEGKLHWWPEVGVIEVLDEQNQAVPPGSMGRLVATGLLNEEMPLVRYEVGDMVEQSDNGDAKCPCARCLPVLGRVLGRNDDVIVTQDGRRIVQIDTIFAPGLHVREAQIVQEALQQFTIRVVPSEGWSDRDAEYLRSALQEKVGEAEVGVRLVDRMERTWAGKFRIITSNLTGEQRKEP
jgi:phenylacetate-CoA ligase